MTDETYNGWSNRETWAMALHIDNNRWSYEAVQAKLKTSFYSELELADWLIGWIDGMVSDFFYQSEVFAPNVKEDIGLMIQDVGSFWRINWPEVARHYLEETRLNGA